MVDESCKLKFILKLIKYLPENVYLNFLNEIKKIDLNKDNVSVVISAYYIFLDQLHNLPKNALQKMKEEDEELFFEAVKTAISTLNLEVIDFWREIRDRGASIKYLLKELGVSDPAWFEALKTFTEFVPYATGTKSKIGYISKLEFGKLKTQ
ncbi:MAG: hypothetical protein QMD14_05415 [Candidatus Aenigmarchaeota archaeon]|nr:hypothetical protein [Candidatus Aenigmarchaeota archaeon]